MRVLIAGCGRLGGAAALLLRQAGHQVYGLRRSPVALAGIEAIAADLGAKAQLQAAIPADLDAVVYALTPARRDQTSYRQSYIEYLHNLLALPQLADPAQHWLFVSSTAVYGDAGGGWVDEHSAAQPEQFNGCILLQAEQSLAAQRPCSASLRLGGIYGPGRTYLIQQLSAGALRVQRAWPHYSNRIHSVDAARLIAQITQQRATGVYNGVDQAAAAEDEVADWLAARLHLPAANALPDGADDRPNKRIRSARLTTLGFIHRYLDYRVGYSALMDRNEHER